MFLTAFLIFAIAMFLFVACIWGKGNWKDRFFKIALFVGVIWAVVELLIQMGWMFKVSGV